jgi:hypothetical protein
MERLSSVSSTFEGYQPSHQSLIFQSTCLWVWHADKIPPHVGISAEGNYFSLKVKGKDADVSVKTILDLIDRKKIPTLCYVLSDDPPNLAEVFQAYTQARAGEITCLYPIREALRIPEAGQLSDVLKVLEGEGRIHRALGLYLPENYRGLPHYGLREIHERLERLSHE